VKGREGGLTIVEGVGGGRGFLRGNLVQACRLNASSAFLETEMLGC